MTKLEAIQHLLRGEDADKTEIMIPAMLNYTDEKLLRVWNHHDQINKHGLRLVKVDTGFEIEFYAPIQDFFREAWINSLKN
jgi:hypothetical protein